ncbi:hypothetical protein FB192DRAFT_1340530 [Mucor lusitanicus]|uniref:HECT-type E3 ubiquitin transferase n=1 Tax=Mucor circinelloides f. lusitanicus TaxID=29924 RepID=A0A8H4BQV5_MUCCL|nr:hypothetical protein FB192DRAFT_1340530 [Mucor lusitanicus]
MFSPTNQTKEKFIETTRQEREKREKERIKKQQQERETKAATTIQSWWKRREQRSASRMQCQAWWNSSMDKANELSILDFYQLLGVYCIMARHGVVLDNGQRRLVKCLTRNTFKHNNAKVPYYCLLIDMRYMDQAVKYLEVLIVQCIAECTSSNDTTSFGPELTFLLQYLNPKTYATRHMLDTCHVIDIPDKILQSRAQTILKRTLCQFNLRDALILCVQHMIKLQDRKDATAKLNACKLWLSTMTRLTLYPIENAELSSDALDMATACHYLWTNTLAVPCITRLVNDMMADRLRTWALTTVKTYLMEAPSASCMEQLDGNGSLFLLANLVDLWNSDKNPQKTEHGAQMMEWTAFFFQYMEPRFSDRQSPSFPAYHPIFKWSKATWGNSIPSVVFDNVMCQLEYLWSRSFMDQLFADIIQFDTVKNSPTSTTSTKMLFSKKSQPHTNSHHDTMALFSMQVASIFSMYMQLTQVFKAHRRVIFYRIAFTSQLMPQLWKLMNCFGPKGNMVIYLNAAKQADINREPLVQILKVFCEACSIVFLTLDDVDIFTRQEPFSPSTLIDISRFLNQFYFSLIQQHTDIPSELPPAANAFTSARRLLLQIYDLDLHHPFCPPNHWLLIQTSSSNSIKSLFSSLFNENTKDTLAAMFVDKLKQGDPVPLRILQLMPHTVSFDMRLKIFREWIELDKYTCTKTANRHITVRRSQVLEDGYQQLVNLPASAWKGTIRVSFVNELGMEEAGIDQGGPFKDFLTMMIAEAFEPNYGLFSSTKTHSFYPSATSSVHGRHHIQLFEFIGKAIGKALYEGVLLDVQFAGFLLARLLGRNVFLQELKELDEEVWRNLTFIKHYDGNVEDLCLSFEADEQVFGKVESHELKFRGKSTIVTNSNKVEYVYLMADYKLNQRAKEQTKAFIRGFRTVISESWIRLFSPPELQRVLSGEDTDFDVNDLRKHTQYDNGYFDHHPVIRSLWQIVAEFNSTEKRAFLKFVTGCPKPPLGGFDYLQPAFTVRMVSIDSTNMDGTKIVKSFFKLNLNNNKSGRLPSSSTCFNLLKLPAYTKKSLLKEKLVYA